MAKAKKDSKPKVIFTLSKSMRNKLPAAEREGADKAIWDKSAGICALCSLPLDLATADSVVADHTIPDADGGKATLSNLYLAHRTCNASRQHLSFEVARPLIRFRSLAEQKKTVDFDTVIDNYVTAKNRSLISYEDNGKTAFIKFGHSKIEAPLSVDPATNVKYFFIDVPFEYVHNDVDIQPRAIIPSHVRKLAIDFLVRPVHEPSNCRLVRNPGVKTGRLLQFDGQHKTTAQILIGRKSGPMKIYVEPEIDMLQELVIKIQQEIKKQPLTKSETLAKIGDVVKRLLDTYEEKGGKHRSEKGLIASQPKGAQTAVKKLYLEELQRIIFFDDENLLSKAVLPGSSNPPTTDKVVITKIINPLLYSQLLTDDLDASGARDIERANILFVLNAITDKMLPPGWEKNTLLRLRATNFFYQGSIGWWMSEILVPSLRYVLYKLNKPLFLEQIDESSKEQVLSLVEKLCAWDIWSTDDSEDLKAMRSNTVKNVSEVFGDYDSKRLLKEIEG